LQESVSKAPLPDISLRTEDETFVRAQVDLLLLQVGGIVEICRKSSIS
jgi:hypothetical protein